MMRSPHFVGWGRLRGRLLLGFAVAGVVLGGVHAALGAAVAFIWCLVLTPITCVGAWRRGCWRSIVASPLHLEVALESGATYRSEPRRMLRVDGRTIDAASIRDVYVRRFPEGMVDGRIAPPTTPPSSWRRTR
jgi:hypothetical protein